MQKWFFKGVWSWLEVVCKVGSGYSEKVHRILGKFWKGEEFSSPHSEIWRLVRELERYCDHNVWVPLRSGVLEGLLHWKENLDYPRDSRSQCYLQASIGLHQSECLAFFWGITGFCEEWIERAHQLLGLLQVCGVRNPLWLLWVWRLHWRRVG